jgi:GTP cyclohydrolase I
MTELSSARIDRTLDGENVVQLSCATAPAQLWRRPERTVSPADWARFEANIAEIFEAFGLELGQPGTETTPTRFLQALYDATSGYDGDPKLSTSFPSERGIHAEAALGQVVEGPIHFVALCEHHALPFHGVAHVAYVPGDTIIGISKLTRLVRLFARRFTVQERLGEQIADGLTDLVAPRGVAVRLEATHLCTSMRGVEERSSTLTTVWRGAYEDPALRHEFLQLVSGSGR